jgi:hypothetical protein
VKDNPQEWALLTALFQLRSIPRKNAV